MRVRKAWLGLPLLALVFLTLSSMMAQTVSAGYNGDYKDFTYFRGKDGNNGIPSWLDFIDNGPGGNYSAEGNGFATSVGFVMPNRQNTYAGYGGDTGQGGAIGTNALGYAGNDNATRKQKLYDLLQRSNNSGTDWEKMGSALVVHQMLGKKTPTSASQALGDGARNISTYDAGMWNELHKRLVENPDITMSLVPDYRVVDRMNTAGVVYYDGGQKIIDVIDFFISDSGDQSGYEYAWVFQDKGNTAYVLEVNCANPIGDFDGLPEYESDTYRVIPSASIDKTVVEPGDTAKVTNTATNVGKDPSGLTLWRLTKLIYDPGKILTVTEKKTRTSDNEACNSFPSSGRSECNTVQEQTDVVFNPGVPRTFNPVYTYTIPDDMPVGTKICFAASVSRPTEAATPIWRHSAMECITVGKKPKLQVWGGDLRTGGKIDTSTSTITSLNSTFGSWVEYGALSIGSNSGFGSGSGLNNGNGNSSQSSWSNLTFANTGSAPSCSFGCYNFTLSSAGLVSQFTSQSSTPVLNGTVVNLNDLASGTYQAGNITLSGTTISSGKTIILVSTGTVTIDGSITYEDKEYTSIRDIPQAIIRAPRINIRGGASQVDAWLLAVAGDNKGVLNTCSDVGDTDKLSANICSNQLTINGPVVADIVYLRRTAGSDSQPAQRSEPAEIFNLRADAYLWANAYSSGQSRVQTVYTKELSPRF